VAGENLGTLAVRYYGKYALWTVIYEANREKIGTDPNRLPLGLELIIPPEP
jgi:nucleoid-associated protein YgaU